MILGIYGAGGLGREVYELAKLTNSYNNYWQEIFFIDDGEIINNPRNALILKFKNLKEKFNLEDIEVCIAIGEPYVRKEIFLKLLSKKISITTLVDPDVSIPDSTKIGAGTIICKYVSITSDVKIGKNVYVHPMACIGHDSQIGDHSIISSYVDVTGECIIGSETFLAIGTIMKQQVKIGSGCILGMGSVVYNNISDNLIAMGNPARPMKKNEEKKVFK